METSNAAPNLKDTRRALRQELEAEEQKRVATAERDTERARECKRKTVDALEEARAYARRPADVVVALMQRNKELETKLATATAKRTRLRM